MLDEYSADRERFWKEISADLWAQNQFGKNYPAYALFAAIEKAFASCDKMRGIVPVDRELLQYLAGWSQDVMGRYEHRSTKVLDNDANHFLRRSLEGFFSTVVNAIKTDQIRHFEDGSVLYGCLKLPKWLVEKYTAKAAEEAENRRAFYREHGLSLPTAST